MGDTRLEPLVLTEHERRTLQGWVSRRKTAQGLARRAAIVLECAKDKGAVSITAVAARVRADRRTVARWRSRFLAKRLDGLTDEPRPGVPRSITDTQVEQVVVRTLEEVPEGSTHWSKRELARMVGISPTSVQRIWKAFGLQVAIAIGGGGVDGVIMHTDQGGEYAGNPFKLACVRTGVTQSMGRTGSALDNAVAESFNSTLEFELRRRFTTRQQARRAVAAFIDEYNLERRNTINKIDGLSVSPVAYEQAQAEQARARQAGKDAA